MPDEPINGREPDKSEDDMQREKLGPRGVPGKERLARMTAQREKKTPKEVDPAIPRELTKRGKKAAASARN